MQKIIPCLWFEHNAEEAVNFYLSVFKDAKILEISRYGESGFMPAGTIMTITFLLKGQEFMALNGGPYFQFTPAISFLINCENQAEIDDYWERLSAGGTIEQCGWLKDKFGVSWQIVPIILGKMLQDKDSAKSNRVMQAALQMVKIDINALEKAYLL